MQDEVLINYLPSQGEKKIAYKYNKGVGPTVLWCGGLKSSMDGGKATYLHNWAIKKNYNFIRFDYFGHGASDGNFRDGTITIWTDNIITVIDKLIDKDVILAGSSMGGWTSILAAIARRNKVKGLFLIAPAPDFTQRLVWDQWTDEQKQESLAGKSIFVPSGYDEDYEYSSRLISDGKDNMILDNKIDLEIPIRILQGMKDEVVPWEYSYKILEAVKSKKVSYTLIKNGDHSLSTPADLSRLSSELQSLLKNIDA
ncbi:MAG: alpha/beta hydrolase [Hellea sp.]|jgi:pimeloyl-ACP methyl ester carboxylesterase